MEMQRLLENAKEIETTTKSLIEKHALISHNDGFVVKGKLPDAIRPRDFCYGALLLQSDRDKSIRDIAVRVPGLNERDFICKHCNLRVGSYGALRAFDDEISLSRNLLPQSHLTVCASLRELSAFYKCLACFKRNKQVDFATAEGYEKHIVTEHPKLTDFHIPQETETKLSAQRELENLRRRPNTITTPSTSEPRKSSVVLDSPVSEVSTEQGWKPLQGAAADSGIIQSTPRFASHTAVEEERNQNPGGVEEVSASQSSYFSLTGSNTFERDFYSRSSEQDSFPSPIIPALQTNAITTSSETKETTPVTTGMMHDPGPPRELDGQEVLPPYQPAEWSLHEMPDNSTQNLASSSRPSTDPFVAPAPPVELSAQQPPPLRAPPPPPPKPGSPYAQNQEAILVPGMQRIQRKPMQSRNVTPNHSAAHSPRSHSPSVFPPTQENAQSGILGESGTTHQLRGLPGAFTS
ncbi:uncharacterized protein BDR25DRAFT_60496 [Lindgomyces ingoldianus]|uniref:Uncharacterized protein n=1 Tax=Lindgomyces ingoldianus TaxID=673940 RepID=A0ACB6QLY3_9PLEO|nr:uncharacterized protein BDR25DRAFT_60496 [Lindgomyces ingoldianus]KAF2467906.1 hypothetical protein BDR25DRAFT_60496 [Lindgomyces ingoldianus]